LVHNGEIYNHKELRKELSDNHRFRTKSDSEVIVHLVEEYISTGNDLLKAINKTANMLDGIYAFAIKDCQTGLIALARDQLGVRQLYYTDNEDILAFASERKSLRSISPKAEIKRIMPGTIVLVDSSFSIRQFEMDRSLLSKAEGKKIIYQTKEDAVLAYKQALMTSMKKRTRELEKVGIIFSGGIDSVLIAYLAKKMVPNVACYCGGLEGSPDILFTKEVAKRLNLPLYVNELSVQDVEKILPKIVEVIEDNNVGQVEVAIPVFAAIELAHRDGLKVMYTGQGADELFGGYPWYPRIVEREGYSTLGKHMANDLSLLYKETLEREDKIAMYHSVEIREPYLDTEVIRVALRTKLELNVIGKDDIYGKRIHRDLAIKLGIPYDVAYRKKEAAQHGSGIHEALNSIAKAHGYDAFTVPENYLGQLNSREKVGSSQRYGFKYCEHSLWAMLPHVQLYLDQISSSHKPAIEIPKVRN